LKYCRDDKLGGFAGGYLQLPHFGPTYAALLCIINIGPSAYHLVDKNGLTKLVKACKI
jgi:prenyltransferase beta subunit